MFLEELDYWLIKMCGPPIGYIGLGVLKTARNYVKLDNPKWKYVQTTLDFAYLEIRRLRVQIDRNDPFYIVGDFGGKFAVYGEWELEENQITKYHGFKLVGDMITHDVDKMYYAGSYLYPRGSKSRFRRTNLSERRALKKDCMAT